MSRVMLGSPSRAGRTSRLIAGAVGCALCGLLSTTAARADAVSWIGGGTNANWSNTFNWLYYNRPDDGSDDTAYFNGHPARLTATVDQDYSIRSVRFNDDSTVGESSFTLNGSSTLSLSSGLYNTSSKTQTVSVPLRFTGSAKISNNEDNGGYGYMNISSSIDTNGRSITVQPSSNGIDLSGNISGSGSLTVDGPGVLNLTGSNSFSGGLTIDKGTVQHNSGYNLGAIAGTITFNQTESGYVPTLQRNGAGTDSSPIAFTQGEGRFGVADGVSVTLTGASSGSGTLGKTGTGTLVLSGDFGYDGVHGNSGAVHVYGGTLQVTGRPRLPSSRVTVDAGATLRMDDGIADLIGALDGAGNVQFGTGGGFNIGLASDIRADRNGTGTFTGTISGNNLAFIKQGSGTFTVTGSSGYSGTTTIYGGTVVANNTSGSATGSSAVGVSGGGTLAGGGTVLGTVTLGDGGMISPSNLATPGANLGSLTVGGLLAQTGSTTTIELSAGGGNDRVIVTGDASLDGTLALSRVLNLNLNPGAAREILHVNGTLTGAFANVTGNSQSPTQYFAVTYAAHAVLVSLALPGDASLNGSVDFIDLLALARNYGGTGKSWTLGDFNGDGATNFTDLLALARNYGQTSAALADPSLPPGFTADWALAQSLVPEPGVALLGIAGAIGALRRQRR